VYASNRVLPSQSRPIIADVSRKREREREREDPLEIASKITFEFVAAIAADVPQPRARDLYRARVYLAMNATSRDSTYSKGRFKGAYIRAAYPEFGSPARRGEAIAAA